MAQAELKDIRVITVSGRIASGSTTLAKNLAQKLEWKHIEGGDIFWEKVRAKLGLHQKDTHKRPDEEDQIFDDELKKMLKSESHLVLETKLAGFNAQGISGVFKILVVCDDEEGNDHIDIRIDRLLNREKVSVVEAKAEVKEREQNDIEKYRRLYAPNESNWVYWDKKYYDFIVNTFSHNSKEAVDLVIEELELRKALKM